MIVGDSSGRVHDCGCAAKIGGHYDPEKEKKKKTGGGREREYLCD